MTFLRESQAVEHAGLSSFMVFVLPELSLEPRLVQIFVRCMLFSRHFPQVSSTVVENLLEHFDAFVVFAPCDYIVQIKCQFGDV